MKGQKLSNQMMWAILITFLLIGCGAPPSAPTATPTIGPPIEVIFYGNDCTVSGPSEIPIGDYPINLNNQSDFYVNLYVSKLTDGKTFQDFLDLQSEPGEFIPQHPSWVVGAQKTSRSDSEDTIYVLVEPGEYALFVYSLSPMVYWLCAPIEVVEAPSE